jgi:hypothetical protein
MMSYYTLSVGPNNYSCVFPNTTAGVDLFGKWIALMLADITVMHPNELITLRRQA